MYIKGGFMNLKVKMIKLMAIAGVISMMISYMIILNKEFCFFAFNSLWICL